MSKIIYKDESYKIIEACLEVHKRLGNGFLEPVYQEALMIEFDQKGIPYEWEKVLNITYRDRTLEKKYNADFVCFDKIILEIKALKDLTTDHEAQIINYLKASNYHLGLLVNFGRKSLQYKRLIRSHGYTFATKK